MRVAPTSLALALLLAGAGPAQCVPPVVEELAGVRAGVEIAGAPLQIVYDADTRNLLIATLRKLYALPLDGAVTKERVRLLESVDPSGRIFASPGGGAWANTSTDGATWRFVQAGSGPATQGQPLQPAPGVTWKLSMGYRGRLALIGRPLDDFEGLHGRWEWLFWKDGRQVGRVETATRRPHLHGPRGNAVIFLETDRAVVYDSEGSVTREIPGGYRKVALSSGGRTVLLNHSERINHLVLDRAGRPVTIDAGAPVHSVALSPDGSEGVVGFANGFLREMDTRRGVLGGRFRFDLDKEAFITSLYIDDRGLITAGLAVKSEPRARFDTAWILQAQSGNVLWHREHRAGRVSAILPQALPIGRDHVALRDGHAVTVYRIDR